MKAMRFHQHGGPEVLVYEDAPEPEAGPGEAVVQIEAIGLNYIDTYHRDGLYPVELPCIPGMEAAGTIARVGEGVTDVQVGDRVAYAGAMGAYAEQAAVPTERLVSLPDSVSFEVGAAALLQGMTAHYLSHGSYPLGGEDVALIHAAAGGVGLLLVQMAKRRGARVLATVSTAEKEQLARGAGADEVIRYTERDFAEAVMSLTDGRGVDVVYDSVGKTTFDKSLDVLRPLGYMVLFGQSSGPVDPIDPGILNIKGSLFLTRPTMAHYIQTREALLERAGDVLGWIGSGELDLRIGDRFALAAAADAHRALQGRETTGKVILLPHGD
jgi:NADPH2:quinone reductase